MLFVWEYTIVNTTFWPRFPYMIQNYIYEIIILRC